MLLATTERKIIPGLSMPQFISIHMFGTPLLDLTYRFELFDGLDTWVYDTLVWQFNPFSVRKAVASIVRSVFETYSLPKSDVDSFSRLLEKEFLDLIESVDAFL
jgi:hypothetical protein